MTKRGTSDVLAEPNPKRVNLWVPVRYVIAAFQSNDALMLRADDSEDAHPQWLLLRERGDAYRGDIIPVYAYGPVVAVSSVGKVYFIYSAGI
jgi:hypothetical protein